MNQELLDEVIGEDTLLVQKTLRSGQSIKHSGNVVVLGDVNPGAEIIAGGHVIVLGTIRGVVHAGAAGDLGATITAFHLNPTQLRIGNLISRPPEGDRLESDHPETARITKNGSLIIEKYQPSR
jgi:septum site-determining protein MinC